MQHTFGVGAMLEGIAGVSEAICMTGAESVPFTKRF